MFSHPPIQAALSRRGSNAHTLCTPPTVQRQYHRAIDPHLPPPLPSRLVLPQGMGRHIGLFEHTSIPKLDMFLIQKYGAEMKLITGI